MKAYKFRLSGAIYEVGSFLNQATQIDMMTLRKSTNDGGSWEQITIIGDRNSYAYAVAAGPTDDRIIYVGGYRDSTDGYYYPALLKSTDKGVTWAMIGGSVLTNRYDRIKVLECDKNNPQKVFAGTYNGLYVTTNGGSSWTKLLSYGVSCLLVDPSNSNTVYVGLSSYGIKRSTNGGTTWSDFNENLGSLNVRCIDYDAVNGALYVGTTDLGVFRRLLSPSATPQPPPASWAFRSNTGKNATIAVSASANLSLGTRQLGTGDAIGAFFTRNDSLICAGYTILKAGQSNAITIWGDDDQTTMKDGFVEGEVIKFRIWDALTSNVYNASAQFSQGGSTYSSNGLYALSSLTAVTTMTHGIILQQGWNLISSYLAPQDSTLDNLFTDVRSNMVIAKNGAGQVYWPVYSINSVGKWNKCHGYQINMQALDTLTVSGQEISPQQTPMVLSQGWNMVAYLKHCPMRADSAFASISNSLTIAKNGAGQVYWPAFSINSIGNMRPGQGYQVYLTSGATLTYPANTASAPPNQLTKKQVAAMSTDVEPKYYKRTLQGTGSNATVLVEGTMFREGDEVGAWAAGTMVGSGVVENGRAVVTIWGDDTMTEAKDGASEGEVLLLTVWSEGGQKEQPLEYSAITNVMTGGLVQGVLRYHSDGVFVFNGADCSVEGPSQFALGQNYPNPFNPETAISYQLVANSFVTLKVFDLLGREVATLVEGVNQPGVHTVRWDASSMTSGVYVYRLQSGANVASRKMVLVK